MQRQSVRLACECERMGKRTFDHATLAFVTAYLLVLAYLFSFYGGQLPLVFFWAPMLAAISLVAWQCTMVESDKWRTGLVLSEVLAIGFLAHMLFVIPTQAGVIGRDVFADLNATEFDMQFGWPLPASLSITGITRTVSEWPLIHFLGIAASRLLGTDLFSVSNPNNIMRWFPSVISMGASLFWYSIAKRIYGRNDVSLLASLGSTMVFYNLMFHSWFVRETLGYVLLFAFLLAFVIASTEASLNLKMKILAILLLIALLFSHHLSFVFALLFLVLVYFLPRLVNRMRTDVPPSLGRHRWEGEMPAGVLLVLGGTMFVAYLIYVGEPIFGLVVDSLQALFEPSVTIVVRSSGTLVSRDRILLTARVALGLVFAIVLVRKILQKRKTLLWDAVGLAWGSITALAVVVTYVVANVVNAGILRLEGFGWPFVLMPASEVTVERRRRLSGVVLITVFVMLNILVIPPYIYDSSAHPDYQVGETSIRYSRALFEAATWFTGNGTIVGDVSTFELFGDFGQRPVVTDFHIFEGNLTSVTNYQWIVLRQENVNVVVSLSGSKVINKISPSVWSLMNSTNALSRVYDNGDVEIFEVTQH